MRDGLIAPYFRRAAALLRHTPNLRMLQLVHVGLSEKVSQTSTCQHTPYADCQLTPSSLRDRTGIASTRRCATYH